MNTTLTTATKPSAVDTYDVRDLVVALAENDPAKLCDLLHDLALDMRGARYRTAGPYAKAAVEAGYALAEVALRFARVADDLAEQRAAALPAPPAAA